MIRRQVVPRKPRPPLPVLPLLPEWAPSSERIPIEELSRRTGVTVRNLRELHTRELLEPPLLEGRKARYTERHVARVGLVRRLRDRGYSLAAIADLLESWVGRLGPLGFLHLEDGIGSPAAGPERSLRQDELFHIMPELGADPRLLERALQLELVRRDEDGSLAAPNAELVAIGRSVLDSGLPPAAILDELEQLRHDAERIAERFRRLFHEHLVAPIQSAGMPAERMKQLADDLPRLRSAVLRAVAILLGRALDRGGPPPAAATRTARRSARPKGHPRS